MGSDKLLLPVPPRGIPLIWHATERLMTMAARTVVVANSTGVCEALLDSSQSGRQRGDDPAIAYTDTHCIPDDSPDDGPLGGLATGLRRIEGWALTVAGDMPFLSAAACQYMTDLADGGCDAIVPVLEGRSQPLHALYHSRCLPAVENVLAGLRAWTAAYVASVGLQPAHCAPSTRNFAHLPTSTRRPSGERHCPCFRKADHQVLEWGREDRGPYCGCSAVQRLGGLHRLSKLSGR